MARGCVIFDFDGVIADTEALHWGVYNQVLSEFAAEIGGKIEVGREQYFSRYIVFGDREGFFHMLRDHGREAPEALLEKLVAAKQAIVEEQLSEVGSPLPGVRELLAWLEARGVPRGICSGAHRGEILRQLEAFGILGHFEVVVAIEDVRLGKPEPEGYLLAFERLNAAHDGELAKEKSVVIEDSEGGCAAAKAAGLRVLGVGTSLPMERLKRCATMAVETLAGMDHGMIARWLGLHG